MFRNILKQNVANFDLHVDKYKTHESYSYGNTVPHSGSVEMSEWYNFQITNAGMSDKFFNFKHIKKHYTKSVFHYNLNKYK